MDLDLVRLFSEEGGTPGDLYIAGKFHCLTLEDPVRDIKIPKKTAIPAGRYRLTFENSPRFGPDTLTINDVPGFTGVRIHAGNTVDDTDGCPLVGYARTRDFLIIGGTSRPALDHLKQKLKLVKEKMFITIHDPRRSDEQPGSGSGIRPPKSGSQS